MTVQRNSQIRVRVRQVDGSPVASLRLWLWGGSRCESVAGLSWVTGRMLTEGTRGRGWREIAEECEALGALLGSFGGIESHGIAIDCLARDWRFGIGLLEELAFDSSFPEARCRWVCTQGIAELDSLDDQPDACTAWAFNEQLYQPHACARPRPGTRDSLASISGADCEAHHRSRMGRGGVLVVAGDVNEDEVRHAVGDRFRLTPTVASAEETFVEWRGTGRDRQEISTPAVDQAHLFAGHVTVAMDHPDLPHLEVASIVLGSGAGLSGRIPERVREQEGLAYSASATLVLGAGLDPGRCVAHVGTSAETVERAELCVREEMQRLVEDGMSDTEFEEARAYVLRREPFRRETARQWAGLIAQGELYGQQLEDPEWVAERYRSLDRCAVEEALRRHLRPDDLKITVGLPGAAAPAC